jgi:hypothetical protein
MENVPANEGLWLVLPRGVYEAAVKHGNLRQAEAIRRRAHVRYDPETPVWLLADQHVNQSIFERGVALALGLFDPKRVNTDHDQARLNLPDKLGLWPRACKKFGPPYIKGLEKDFDLLVGGRVHDNEMYDDGETYDPRCIVEVRCWANMQTVKHRYHLVDLGKKGAPFYQIFWGFKDVYPIRVLVDQYGLDTSACLPKAPASISETIEFAPEKENKQQCEDGCLDRRPSEAGGYVCNRCGYYLWR